MRARHLPSSSRPGANRSPLAGLRLHAQGGGHRSGTHALIWQRLALWCLLLALVWVPTMGRLHQVLHAPPALSALSALPTADGSAQLSSATPATPAHGLLSSWLVLPHASADCVLLDQLALGMGWPAALCLPPAVPVAQALVPPEQLPLPTQPVAHFWARGPPSTGAQSATTA